MGATSKKRSEAAKKSAETRRKNAAAAQEEPVQEEQPDSSLAEVERQPEVESFRADVRVNDQVAQEERRQAKLAEAREEHNRRTGDASLVRP